MMKKCLAFISMLLLAFTTLSSAHAAKKCSDFGTQAQAQSHYKALKRANKTGWKSLDRNKDGIACNCLKTKSCSKGKKKGLFSKKSSAKKASSKHSKKYTKASKANKTANDAKTKAKLKQKEKRNKLREKLKAKKKQKNKKASARKQKKSR